MDKPEKLGFLFPKQSKNGKSYYSGKIKVDEKEISIVGFNSKSKNGQNYISLSVSTPFVPKVLKPEENNVIDIDNLPF